MGTEKYECFDWDSMPDDAPNTYEDNYRYHTFAARATLYPGKTDEEVLEIIETHVTMMRDKTKIKKQITMETDFRKELENLVNKYSKENGSATPDFILARYLDNALQNFDAAVKEREEWYGRATHLEDLDLGIGSLPDESEEDVDIKGVTPDINDNE